jgi:hypothetical protein
MAMKASVVVIAGRLRSVPRQWLARSVLFSLLSCLGGPTPAAAQSPWKDRDSRDPRVMTYNVDEGTDFLQIQAATDLNSFLVAVGQTITQGAWNQPSSANASGRKADYRG